MGVGYFASIEGVDENMNVIYEPTGAALEYAPLGLNIYTGCLHRCSYCYNSKSRFFGKGYCDSPRKKMDVIPRLEQDLQKMKKNDDDREILLSFVGDVYQPDEKDGESRPKLTREAIERIISYDRRFTILTKGGLRVLQDFGILSWSKKFRFGTSLVFIEDESIKQWEPGATSLKSRVKAMEYAKAFGIPTWVSIEPVIDPQQALIIVNRYHDMVDHWKVGKIRHEKLNPEPDWIAFRDQIEELFDKYNADYYIKNSLRSV